MSLLSRHVEFYDFTRGPQHWRYVAEKRPLVVDAQTYDYASIKRGRIVDSADAGRATLDLTVTGDLPLLDLYRGTAPMEDVGLSLYRLRTSDSTVTRLWTGTVGSVEFTATGATIHCLPPIAAARGLGLRRTWARNCPHALYSAGLGQCNANRAPLRVDAALATVAGAQVQAAAWAAYPDGWFAGGWIEWQVGTATERRFIVAHAGITLTLLTPPLAAVGTIVATYPGCDGTLATCNSRFGNSANFGGQPWIPEKNPFGDPVY